MSKVVKKSPACEGCVYDERRVITLNITAFSNDGQHRNFKVEFDEFDWTYRNVMEVLRDQFNWHGSKQSYCFYGLEGQKVIMRGLRERTFSMELYDRGGGYFEYMEQALEEELEDLKEIKAHIAAKTGFVDMFTETASE